MYKMLVFLKRKPGLSTAEFRDYYESHHRKLGERLVPGMRRYVRRYIDPLPGPVSGQDTAQDSGPDFDVITELWFDDRAAFDAMIAHTSQPAIAQALAEDEARFIDRTRMIFTGVDEVESDLGQTLERAPAA